MSITDIVLPVGKDYLPDDLDRQRAGRYGAGKWTTDSIRLMNPAIPPDTNV